jgi:hypothetical protein
MDIERAIAMITGYADAAMDAAAHAAAKAESATGDVERRLWEAEASKEHAVARAYRVALNEIRTALDASEAPA